MVRRRSARSSRFGFLFTGGLLDRLDSRACGRLYIAKRCTAIAEGRSGMSGRVFLAFIAVASAFMPLPAFGCTCIETKTGELFDRAERVFEGVVQGKSERERSS